MGRGGLPCLLLLLTAASSALSAQVTGRDSLRMTEPLGVSQVRQGLWLSGGLGYGTIGCCGRSSTGGLTGGLEVGWTFSRRFLLGIGTSAWHRGGLGDTGRVGITAGSVDLRVRWYPSEMAGGFFLTGGGGLGFFRLTDPLAIPTSHTSTGHAFRAGLGYDFRIARGLSVTPLGTWSAIRTENNGDRMQGDVWQAGLWLTVH